MKLYTSIYTCIKIYEGIYLTAILSLFIYKWRHCTTIQSDVQTFYLLREMFKFRYIFFYTLTKKKYQNMNFFFLEQIYAQEYSELNNID